MFIPLIVRTCLLSSLSTDQIIDHIKIACKDNKLVSDIDWDSLIESIDCEEFEEQNVQL